MTSRVLLAAVCAAMLVSGCKGPVSKAEALIKRGAVTEAERVLIAELAKNPRNLDARIILGRVYLLQHRDGEASAILDPLATTPQLTIRIAREYHQAAINLSTPLSSSDMASYAVKAARLDPSLQREACQTLLKYLRGSRDNWRSVTAESIHIGDDCRQSMVELMKSWIDQADPTTADLADIEAIGVGGRRLDAQTELARAVRDLATRASNDRRRAARILDVASRIDQSIDAERETASLREKVVGTVAVASASFPSTNFAGSPLEVTKRTMQAIGSAMSRYASVNRRYPPASSASELVAAVRQYARLDIPSWDGWGAGFEYVYSK
ncbi:MAG: hypothetical protein ACXW2Q_10520, partial [Thermoanaerobaculia bacterium]